MTNKPHDYNATLNALYKQMDYHLGMLLATQNMKHMYYVNMCEMWIKQIVEGHADYGYNLGMNTRKIVQVKPLHTGHIHLDKNLEYLHGTIKFEKKFN